MDKNKLLRTILLALSILIAAILIANAIKSVIKKTML